MDLSIRLVTPDDRTSVDELFIKRSSQIIVDEYWTNLALVLIGDEKIIGYTSLYPLYGTKVCMIDNFIIDKDLNKEEHNIATNTLLDGTLASIQKQGFTSVRILTAILKVVERLESRGFIAHDKQFTHLVGRI